MKKLALVLAAVVAATLMLTNTGFAASKTLQVIKKRGALRCGVNPNTPGYASLDSKGVYQGFDTDFCRAIAAAIQVDVQFFPLTGKERFPALQSGEVDMLSRRTTWTMSRDTRLGFQFAAVTYYDGQGFIVRKKSGIKSAKELDGATVCVATGTTTELNLADYFRKNKMKLKALTFESGDVVRSTYESGRCDAMTGDASSLAANKTIMKDPRAHLILPEIISKEPLAPLSRHGDNEFNDIIRWVINAIIIAEEKGITQANVEEVATTSNDPEVQRMLGRTGSMGKDLGLDAKWALRAIKVVGNYEELFERHLGLDTPLGLPRGYNRLWNKGGILYAPPVR
ncbi:MAG: amino acid ABC transporter substrate-binding protein [SAR324 cluster bacterium]|nr:amino acid ABC transporter substrate-binding protein [SAR324 cluster bacterium]